MSHVKIDDLFERIEKEEMLDSSWEEMDTDAWTDEKKERVLNKIYRKMQAEEAKSLELESEKESKVQQPLELESEKESKVQQKLNSEEKLKLGKRIKKRRLAFLLAAVLTFSILTAFAWENEWDILLGQYVGLEPEAAVQVAGGSISIEESDTQSGMTVTAVSAIGDQNSQYIRIDTDYPCDLVAQDGTEQACYLFDKISILIHDRKSDSGVTKSFASVMMPFNNEGKLSFWLELVNCSGINRDYITVNVQDLYGLTTDGEYEQDQLLVEGCWTLEWKNYYHVDSRKYYPLKNVGDEEFDCLLTSVEITPISIRLHGYGYSRENQDFSVEKIVMEDGTVYELDSENGGSVSNNFERESYVTIRQIGEVLDPKQVRSVFVRGQEIIF